ncbi:MAG UNVERIFIED_CONTAM: hypothetical protein LVR18_45850 [Planctomycetaceae bacterium]
MNLEGSLYLLVSESELMLQIEAELKSPTLNVIVLGELHVINEGFYGTLQCWPRRRRFALRYRFVLDDRLLPVRGQHHSFRKTNQSP